MDGNFPEVHSQPAQDIPPPRRRSRRRMAELIAYARRRREEENGPPATVIAVSCLVYFMIGVGLNRIDPEFLVAAWLFAGGLAVALWWAQQTKGTVFNPYVVLCVVGVIGCLTGFVLSQGWLI